MIDKELMNHIVAGRDLSAEEELRLRRYSKSIIIKGAKSPERLLDEVTLFLHQVVADLPARQQAMLATALNRDALLEGRQILVAEDDVRNIYALTSLFEPHGATVHIARNGVEALKFLEGERGRDRDDFRAEPPELFPANIAVAGQAVFQRAGADCQRIV